nr:uncharacterized protein LOC107410028 isoform X1 [Ziziphus jujuba var. spinosa]
MRVLREKKKKEKIQVDLRGSTIQSSEMPPLPQCLPLEPITLGNQKYPRPGELRRVLGVPSTSEEHSFGVSHSKIPAPVGTDELKHLKKSVQDGSRKARDRANMLRESIFKLDKYREALTSKKRQRSDLSSSERSSGITLVKLGSQVHRNSHDTINQRLEDKAKSVGLNKRVRTAVADVRADSRSAAISRTQIFADKDGSSVQAVSVGSMRVEEKTRRLLAGGEGLDQRIKKKRSVGAVGNRIINVDRDAKRAVQPKMTADSKLRSCDAHGFRSKSSPGVSRINKLDGSFEPTNSEASIVLKSEPEIAPLPRDRMAVLEQRVLPKGSNKPNIQEGNSAGGPNTVTKGKVSRAPRTGSVMALESSPNAHPQSGALQDWEQPTGLNKVPAVGMSGNQKRQVSTGSSIHHMAGWGGQRSNKNSRSRRTNLVPPVPNNAEAQISSQDFTNPDLNARTSCVGTNGSVLASSTDDSTPKFKSETENVASLYSLSESEESGAGENKIKERRIDSGSAALTTPHKVGAFILPIKKNKIPTGEIGDGVRRQGRSGRGSSLTRPAIRPMLDKSESPPTAKPLQNVMPISDKNRSKTGRPPSKKLKDRKASTRLGPTVRNGTSDFTGESDDDHEELYLAADSARNASSLACSSAFWKKMEYIFASTSSDDTSYLQQQLGVAEELGESLSQMFGAADVVNKEFHNSCGERQDAFCRRLDTRRFNNVIPLCQRVLSAFIEEDESEELYHYSEGKNMSLQSASDDSHCGSCNQIDIEPKDKDRMETEVESNVEFNIQKNSLLDRISCDSGAATNVLRNSAMYGSLLGNEKCLGDDEFSHSDVGNGSEICSNDLGQMQPQDLHILGFPSSDCQYQLMCLDDRVLLELQSIGLYPEKLPDLAEGEELINEYITELQEELHKQIGRKKKNLGKIDRAIQKGRDVERRKVEQIAMDQLVEMAYKKRVACRGSNASKGAVRKVSKQVALAFVKRTLDRCQKFEETGNSCFTDPVLRDVMFSAPSCNSDIKSIDCIGSGTASNTCNEVSHQAEVRGSGAISSEFERYDSHCDNADRGSLEGSRAVFHLSERASYKQGSILNRVKKREVLIDDVVGSASSRVTSALESTVIDGKGKRSERDRDQKRDIVRNNSLSGGCSSMDSIQTERKTKVKSKQKNTVLSTPTSGFHSQNMEGEEPSHGSKQTVVNRKSKSLLPKDSPKEAEEPVDFTDLKLHELDSMEELGVSSHDDDLGEHQDFGSWLNFDEDGLQDHDSIGLEIPMDDLSELNMLM